jgi:cyclohexanone monooxygenase
VLNYLRHVTARWDIRKDMYFNTALEEAHWNDAATRWIVRTSRGTTYRVCYLVTALGLLSRQNFPDIPGIEKYRGEKYHTGAWPQDVTLSGKRVGVIGNGSTGVQVITAIAKDVGSLVSFQRNPQYSVPSGQRPVTSEYRQQVNDNYPRLWEEAKDESLFAFGFKEVTRPTFSVNEEERERIYEAAWRKGGGFRFMFETFGDITLDEAANNAAADFIKAKIQKTVKDPEKARKLLPTQLYARRPLCDSRYNEVFNQDNVDVVSLQETPIVTFTPEGILTEDGQEHKLDVVIFATGFDAVDGNYTRVAIHGREGVSLRDHWRPNGPISYLGVSVPEFPNMFMILGPNGPFCNLPPAIETQVEFISDIIEAAESSPNLIAKPVINGSADNRLARHDSVYTTGHTNGASTASPVIEASAKAEASWTDLCNELSAGSLFRKTDSWIFGSNMAGKRPSVLFYFAGLSAYRQKLRAIANGNWEGFKIT